MEQDHFSIWLNPIPKRGVIGGGDWLIVGDGVGVHYRVEVLYNKNTRTRYHQVSRNKLLTNSYSKEAQWFVEAVIAALQLLERQCEELTRSRSVCEPLNELIERKK